MAKKDTVMFKVLKAIYYYLNFTSIGVSGAQFDAEADFDIPLAVAPRKPRQNYEKLSFRSEQFAGKKSGVEK